MPANSAKVPMGIHGSHSREFSKREILQYLINREIFWIGVGILSVHVVYSLAVLVSQQWPNGSCTSGDISFPLYFLVLPTWGLGHALIFRIKEKEMEPMHVFYNCCLGLTIGMLSLTLGLWIIVKSWSCSSNYFRVAYLECVLLGFGWICIWMSGFLKRFFYDEASSRNSVSYLLIVRCSCIPSGVRKVLLISPVLLSAFFSAVQLYEHWSEACHSPLSFFSLTSIIVLSILSCLSYLILIYGRVFVISSSFNDDPEEISFHPMAMTALWYGAASIHVFSVVWATIGVIWVNRAGICSLDVEKTAVGCISSLYVFGITGPIVSFLFKIENCFPPASGSPIYFKQKAVSRTASSNELLNPPSTHSITGDRDVEMSSDLDLGGDYDAPSQRKKKSKKTFKTGKFLWSNNSNASGGQHESTRGDTDSLLYPSGPNVSGTVSADVVHHHPGLSSHWQQRGNSNNQNPSPVSSPLQSKAVPRPGGPGLIGMTHLRSLDVTEKGESPAPVDNSNLIQTHGAYSTKRMGHLST